MICPGCKDAADNYDKKKGMKKRAIGRKLHSMCRGLTHCDCQHRVDETQNQTVVVPK